MQNARSRCSATGIYKLIAALSAFQGVPALRAQRYFTLAVACNKHPAKLGFGDIAYYFYAFDFFYFVAVGQRHGEEQFVVLAAVKCGGDKISCSVPQPRYRGLVVDGYSVFVHTAAYVAVFAYMNEF